MAKPSLDLFYFPGSTYTYLTALRAVGYATAKGVEINWRPFNVRAIMVEMDNIPFAKKPIKSRYMWRDIERRAGRHGLPWNGQPPYPVDPELKSLKVAIVAAKHGFCGEFTEASYRAWYLDGLAPGLADNTETVLARIGQDVSAVMTEAMSEATLTAIAEATDAARALGVFGSPTFAVGDEIFWGDDRLEDAVDWALDHP